MNEIIIFEEGEVKLEVNMKEETVWLSLEQMTKLFGRDKSVISRHIKNALEEEINKKEAVAKFATTTQHGAIADKTQTHTVLYYNLDVVISVGYRVKSKRGVIFRRWANKVLKDYLIKGYAVNEKRLEYLEKTIKLIDIAGRIDSELQEKESINLIKVINNYKDALNLLNDYDNKTIYKHKGTINNKRLTYKECLEVIEKLKFKNKSDIFAIERNKGLESIINTIYTTYDNKDLYPSVEEKAANLLYLTTKNHVFIDGNKRIAATLFIYFLNYNNILYKDNKEVIDNNTLVAITILIAESNPKEKDVLVDLILNFLNKN